MISAHLAQQNPIVHCLVHVRAIFLQRQFVVHILSSYHDDQVDDFDRPDYDHWDQLDFVIMIAMTDISPCPCQTCHWSSRQRQPFNEKYLKILIFWYYHNSQRKRLRPSMCEPAPLQQVLCGHSSDDHHWFIQGDGTRW